MTFVKWDPFKGVAALQDRINRVFDDTFPRSEPVEEDAAMCDWRPAVDIYESGDVIIIMAEIPGVNKEGVVVEVKDNVLTLRGERAAEENVAEDKYYRKERRFGSFHRAFTLQDAINPDTIKARFLNGVLRVEIPKPESEKPKQVKVDIE